MEVTGRLQSFEGTAEPGKGLQSDVRKLQNFLKLYATLTACADLYVSKESLQSCHDIIVEAGFHFNLETAHVIYPLWI